MTSAGSAFYHRPTIHNTMQATRKHLMMIAGQVHRPQNVVSYLCKLQWGYEKGVLTK